MAKAPPRRRSARPRPLASPLRETGIEVVGPTPWGTHFCQFYGTKSDLVEVLVPYFKAGLEQDEFCMWITSPPLGVREAREALATAVPDLESYQRRGRIEILPHTEWYLVGGSFDQDRVLKGWVDKLEAALARGCAGLRLSGNTFWLEKEDWRTFAEYEAAVDTVLGQYRMLALCTYSLDRCGAAEVADVIRNHQFALIKRDGHWELLESFHRRRMQDALAVERERLAVTLRSIGDAVIATDNQGHVTTLNRAAEDLTGWAQAEAVGRPLAEVSRVVEEATGAEAEDPVRAVLERGAGTAIGVDLVLVARDGRRVAIAESAAPILGDDGHAAGVVIVLRDVTSARRADRAVRESEERYRLLFENLSEGFAVHEVLRDATGRACDYRFLEVNPAFERLTGLTRQATVGRTVREVLPGIERTWIERYAKVAATGVPARFESLAAPLGRHYEVLAFRPRPGHFATLFFDVTERAGAEHGREQLLARLRELQAATEAARQQAENGKQLLEAVMQALPVGVAITDVRGGNLQHNETYDRIWRGPRPTPRSVADYAAFKAWWADGAGEVTPEQWAAAKAVATGEPVLGQVLRIQRFDGSQAFVLNSAAPVRDAGGRVVGSAVAIQDITELREAEEELRRREEHFHALAEALPQIVWTAGADGAVEWLNQRWYDYTGAARGVGEGWSWSALAHPDDRERTLASWQDAHRRGGLYQNEMRLRRHDGDFHWFLARGWPLRDDAGRIVHWFGTNTDIEELKRAQRLLAVLSRVNEAIVRIHEEPALHREVCRIVAEAGEFPLVWIGFVQDGAVAPVASAGSEAGYLSEVRVGVDGELGRGPTGTCIRENRPVVNDDFSSNTATEAWSASAQRHGFRASAAFPLRRRGQVVGALSIYAARPGMFDAEHVRLLEALGADLSYALDALQLDELRRAAEAALRASERSLREVDERKNDFLAVLSHELRNPLAPIRSSLYILDHAQPGDPKAVHAKAVIGRQVEQLSRLVDDLLDVTRIARDKVRLRRERLDVNDLAERSRDDHRSLFEKSEVAFDLELAAVPPFVQGDPARLSQVIGNLLQNAAKFTPRGGRASLSISTEPKYRTASIRVADSGVGMTEDTLARLFEPFMQADKTLDRSKGGLGLGLALVKGLVELHEGTITAHSAGPGKGTEFVVRLPLDGAEGASGGAPSPSRRSRRRVLVIEDNADAADSLAAALRFAGHEVVVAYDGAQGLAAARDFRPQAVLCDIGLPGMDGYEIARVLKADESLRGAFLVALSGYARPEDLERAAAAGFERHVAKPPSVDELQALLAELPEDRAQAAPDAD